MLESRQAKLRQHLEGVTILDMVGFVLSYSGQRLALPVTTGGAMQGNRKHARGTTSNHGIMPWRYGAQMSFPHYYSKRERLKSNCQKYVRY